MIDKEFLKDQIFRMANAQRNSKRKARHVSPNLYNNHFGLAFHSLKLIWQNLDTLESLTELKNEVK